jgi:hypothetical protein
VDVPLNADRSNRFVARGVRTDTEPQIQGPNVALDASLIQDSQNPALSFDSLTSDGELQSPPPFRGEELVNIDWTASDANFSDAWSPMTIEYSNDGGQSWELLEGRYPNDQAGYDWVTEKDNTKDALIRLTATDPSGRSTEKTSSRFEIDSLLPIFLPSLLDPTQIGLNLSEPISGTFAAAEWKIGENTAGHIDPSGPAMDVTSAVLTVNPVTGPVDPSSPPEISYDSANPVGQAQTTQLVDHVGNPLVQTARVPGVPPAEKPAPNQGGSNNSGGTSSEKTAICTMIGTDGADELIGTEGPDVFCPLGGNDKIQGLGGDDIVLSGIGPKVVDGGAGADVINGGPETDTLIGGLGDDLIIGNGNDDHLEGEEGNDTIEAGDGDDALRGGPGIDDLEGEDGNDHLSGGADADALVGGEGNDSMGGGSGDDELLGLSGDDSLRGDDDNDLLDGGEGADSISGGNHNDQLKGGTEDDQLSGGEGRDVLLGHAGRDKLSGEGGKDRLSGGSGKDLLDGGKGRDSCAGGGAIDAKTTCERGPRS